MTIKTRRVLFYSLFFLFIFIGLAVVFYSFGWRINISDCEITRLRDCEIKFQKTGGLFIETKPKGVIIKIDGKVFEDKSGIIQNGTLIKNLSPKTYKIKIEKDNFLPYEKKVRVESNLVAEIPNVVLIPEKLEKTPVPISKSIDNFWISPRQKIVFKSNGVLYYSSPISKLKGNEFIGFSEDGEKIIVKDLTSRIHYLYDLNDLSKSVNINAIFKNLKKGAVVDEIAFHPADSNRLIVSAEGGSASGGKDKNLYFLDLNRLKLEIISEEPVLAWTIKNPNIYYIKETKTQNLKPKTYLLASFNLILKTESVISQFPNFPISQFLNSQIILSPDNKKIAFFNKAGEINIYFLEDHRFGINKKTGDVINLNLYKNKNIENIFWYKDSYHILVEYEEKVDFVEIDDRAPINKYTLIDGSASLTTGGSAPLAVNYDLKSNKVYFLSDKKLYYSTTIIGD